MQLNLSSGCGRSQRILLFAAAAAADQKLASSLDQQCCLGFHSRHSRRIAGTAAMLLLAEDPVAQKEAEKAVGLLCT